MITFISALIALFSVVLIFFPKLKKELSIEFLKKKLLIFIVVIFTFISLVPYLFFFADRGYNYFLVYPTGKTSAVMDQGIKLKLFAKIDPWQKYIDVKVTSKDDDNDELEGRMDSIPLRFIDQVTAKGCVSLRFSLPVDEKDFIDLAIKYRTMKNLVENTIKPTAKEQLVNTAYMYAAQDYISGEAQAFRQTYEENLKGGTYAVRKIEIKDTTYNNNNIKKNNEDRQIKEIQTRYKVVKILQNGIPKRIPHELSENNIGVAQVIVDDIDLEKAFKERLEAQRDESAKRQLEQQKAKTAKDAQLRYIAEGERDKAKEKASQEVAQVKELTTEETKLKKERTALELAEIALKTERLKAQQKKVAADAQYYENLKLVQAGLTPQERAYWNYRSDSITTANISKIKFPESMTIIGGGNTNSSNSMPLESLIGAAMAKQLVSDNKPNKK